MNYNDYWTDTKHSKHETTIEEILDLVLGLCIIPKSTGGHVFRLGIIWTKNTVCCIFQGIFDMDHPFIFEESMYVPLNGLA